MRSIKILRLTLAAALATASAGQAAAENVLRWASAGGVLTWDPHASTTETPSLVGFRQVYEGLTLIDADLSLRPALATSWRPVNPTTWRFQLRRGVSFHNGTPFSVGDAVFSIERARAEGSDLANYTSSIAAVVAVDNDTLEITTKHPDMILPVNLRQVAFSRRCGPRDIASAAPGPTPRTRRLSITPTAPALSCSKRMRRESARSWSAIPTGGGRPSPRTISTGSSGP